MGLFTGADKATPNFAGEVRGRVYAVFDDSMRIQYCQ